MKTAIIKLSGKAIESFTKNEDWLKAFKKIKNQYDGVVIIHGAGSMISEWSSALGIDVSFYKGQRVTDKNVMEVVTAVQAGLVNKQIVSFLQTNDHEAIGLSGIDRGFFEAKYLDKNLGYVGIPEKSGTKKWVMQLLEDNVIPVFSSVCQDNQETL